MSLKLGAWFRNDRLCDFTVWAPQKKQVEIKILSPEEFIINLEKDSRGYWRGSSDKVSEGAEYLCVLDGDLERPDPVSFYQKNGVHKPSSVYNHSSFSWEDLEWKGIPLDQMILYELHVGTFTPDGTFESIIQKLPYLKDLGVNAIEIMPVSQFPGDRNWGYDGVHPYAVQNTYGGPDQLKQLVNACHQNKLAVVLDVVYNHLGPEGNYLNDFAPYFTDKYQTPWGWALNYDGAYSDGVRNYFIQNVLYWFKNFHIDALRLDAVHGIFDFSAKHVLKEMSEAVDAYSQQQKRKHYLIAESDLNDSRIITEKHKGGYGCDAQWLDEFHHSLRTFLTNDKDGYYCDFGDFEHLLKAFKNGYVYDWKYSEYRKKFFGSPSGSIEPRKFIIFTQNHDQVGNRMNGERLSQLVDWESLKLAAGAMIFSPYIPMLFMGQEFASQNPFLYFISHLDPDLVKAVQEGRKKEFAAFQWNGEPPDPFSQETFLQSKLAWDSQDQPKHKCMFEFYKEIIRIRKEFQPFFSLSRKLHKIYSDQGREVIRIVRDNQMQRVICCLNFHNETVTISLDEGEHNYEKIFDSSDEKWNGPGALSPKNSTKEEISIQAKSFCVWRRKEEE